MIDFYRFLKGILLENATDRTKKITISPSDSATTDTTMSVTSAQTDDRTLTLPDATDTLAGIAATQTLTNKTIDGDNNTVQDLALTSLKTVLADADKFLVRNASGVVVSNTVAVPSGPIVDTNSPQTLSNKTLDNSNIITVLDSNLTIQDNADNTKQLKFEASSISTGTTKTLTAPNANTTIVGTDATQTLSNKTVGDALTFTHIATPSNPPAGFLKVYAKADNNMYSLTSAGAENSLGPDSGSGGTAHKVIGGGTITNSGGGAVSFTQGISDVQIAVTTTQWPGQTFTVGSNPIIISTATFRLAQQTGTETGNVFYALYATAAGVPTGSALAITNNLDISTIGLSGANELLTFSTTPTLSAATQYAIIINGSGQTSGNIVSFAQSTDVFANGTRVNTNDSGSSWSAVGASDMRFSFAGTELISVSFTDDLFIEVPGLDYADNTIQSTESPISFPNDLDVAYVIPNSSPGGPDLSIVVADLPTVPNSAVIIARRVDTDVIFGSSSTLIKNGQSVELYGTPQPFLDDVTIADNQELRLKEASVNGTSYVAIKSAASLSGNFTNTLPSANTTLIGNDTSDVLTNKTLSGNTATNLVNAAGTLNINSTGTITVPNATDTLVGKDTSDVLTNKTLSGNTASNLINGSGTLNINSTGTVTVPNTTDTLVGKDTSDVLTNKTLSGNTASNLINGSGTLNINSTGTITVPNATDTLVGKATSDSLTNKTFGDAATFTQIATPSNPSAGFNKLYPKSDNFFYNLNSDGSETRIGSGSGGVNYIENSDAESNTTGWTTYADAAQATPVDGTGGSPTVTWTRTTSSPLRGTGSFLFTKDAANRQGEGVAYPFTIADADKAKPLYINFEYEIASGTYATGDLTVYLYDVTNGVVIQPAGYSIENVGIESKHIASFQTASNSLSYRLIVHVASTSASAYTVKFDTVTTGPQVLVQGAAVTDWTSYTPTGTWVTATTYTGIWRRVGDSMELDIKLAITGTPTNAALTVNLPPGYSIDIAKLTSSTQFHEILGNVSLKDEGTAIFPGWVLYGTAATNIQIVSATASGDVRFANLSNTVPFTWANTDSIYIRAIVPILGWSSNVQMSSDTDTRIVAAKYTMSASTANSSLATGADEILDFDVKEYDTHGAVTTGASWRFTTPVPGKYKIQGALSGAGTATTVNQIFEIDIHKNGGATLHRLDGFRFPIIAAALNPQLNGCVEIDLLVGDYIEFQGFQNTGNSLTLTTSSEVSYISIERLSGPSQIAASEDISAKYTNTGTGTVTNAAIINYANKIWDTHGAVTPGVSWKFTAPVAGKYAITQRLSASAAVGIVDKYLTGRLYINGSASDYIGMVAFEQTTTTFGSNQGGRTVVRLLAGDYIDVRSELNGNARSFDGSADGNWVIIEKVGNY